MRSFVALVVFAIFASAATYTLKLGDTLGGVAARFHVSVGALQMANRIGNPNRVQAGQTLVIPGAQPGAVPAPSQPVSITHVVKSGETLGAIAAKYHVRVAAIQYANHIANPNRIHVGQALVIPGTRVAATWVCPVAGTSRFIDDFLAPRGARRHMGIDMLAPKGTPVVATVGGVLVRHDNPFGGHAYYLHGNDGRVYYGAHLATFVHGDGAVRIGDTIGTVGNSGNAAGGPTHLHFEVGQNGANKDPYPMLVRACLRA